MEEAHATLFFEGVGAVQVDYDTNYHLPTALANNHITGVVEVNLEGFLNEENTNISPAQKLLIHWHDCFGHKSMVRVQ